MPILEDILAALGIKNVHVARENGALTIKLELEVLAEPASSAPATPPQTPPATPATPATRTRKAKAQEPPAAQDAPPPDASVTPKLQSYPDLAVTLEKIGGLWIARTTDSDGRAVNASDLDKDAAIAKLDAEVRNKRGLDAAELAPPVDEDDAEEFPRPEMPTAGIQSLGKLIEALRNVEGDLAQCLAYVRRVIATNQAKGKSISHDTLETLVAVVAHFGWMPSPGTQAEYINHVRTELTRPDASAPAPSAAGQQGPIAPTPAPTPAVASSDTSVLDTIRGQSDINVAVWDQEVNAFFVIQALVDKNVIAGGYPMIGIESRAGLQGTDTASLIAARDALATKLVEAKRAAVAAGSIVRKEWTLNREKYKVLVDKAPSSDASLSAPAGSSSVAVAGTIPAPAAGTPGSSARWLPDNRLQCGTITFGASTSDQIRSAATQATLVRTVTHSPEMVGRLPEVAVVVAAILGSNLFPAGSKLNNPSAASQGNLSKISEFAAKVAAEFAAKANSETPAVG